MTKINISVFFYKIMRQLHLWKQKISTFQQNGPTSTHEDMRVPAKILIQVYTHTQREREMTIVLPRFYLSGAFPPTYMFCCIYIFKWRLRIRQSLQHQNAQVSIILETFCSLSKLHTHLLPPSLHPDPQTHRQLS